MTHNEPLAPIFLNNKPVEMKDPKPRVSSVLSAGGHPGATEVKRLQTQAGSQGTVLRPDATLDRTSEPTKPIYLSSQARGGAAPAGKNTLIDEEVQAPAPLSSQPWPTGTKQAGGGPDAMPAKKASDAEALSTDVAQEGDDEPRKSGE